MQNCVICLHVRNKSDPARLPIVLGYLSQAGAIVRRANRTTTVQRDGLIQVRAASARKAEFCRVMLEVPIARLAEVDRAAAREEHELGRTSGSPRSGPPRRSLHF